MKLKKKILSFLVSILMVLSLFAPTLSDVFAAPSFTPVTYPLYFPIDCTGNATPGDGTPFAVYIEIKEYTASSTYAIKSRIGPGTTLTHAIPWKNATTNTWATDSTAYADLLKITTDASGNWNGWLVTKVKNTATPGTLNYRARMRISPYSGSNIDSSQVSATSLDMVTQGGWISGTAYDTLGNPTAGKIVVIKNSSSQIVGTYITEDNNVNEGYSTATGYYKVAAPAGSGYTVEIWEPSTNTIIGSQTTGVSVEAGKATTGVDINAPTGPTVTVVSTNLMTAYYQRNLGQSVLKLDFASSASTDITSIKIDKTGTASDSDISALKLYEDTNTNGSYDDGADLQLASQTFSSGTLTFSGLNINVNTTKAVFIRAEISPSASIGSTFGINLANSSYITLSSGTVSSSGFSHTSPSKYIGYPVDFAFLNQAPPNIIPPASNLLMMSFSLQSNYSGTASFSVLKVNLSGTLNESYITNTKLYKDVNFNDTLDISDILLANGTFSSGTLNLSFVNQTINDSASNFLILYDLSAFAPNGDTFGVSILNNTYITLDSESFTVDSNFPANSALVTVGSAPSYNLYYGLTHSHTAEGGDDGTGTWSEAYTFARDTASLDFFAVSPHNHMISDSAYLSLRTTAASFNNDGTFVAFAAQEWGTLSTNGHLNIFDANSRCSVAGADWASFISWITNPANGVKAVVFNHPDSGDFNNGTYDSSGDTKIQFVEIFNGPADRTYTLTEESGISTNYESRALTLLNKGWHIGFIGSQDNHNATWGLSTQVRTVVLASSLTKSNVLDAYSARRVYATSDHNLRAIYTINSNPMGSIINASGDLVFHFDISDPDSDIISNIQIYADLDGAGGSIASVISTINVNASSYTGDILINAPANSGIKYYFVKVNMESGRIAYLSPIWVDTSFTGGANFDDPEKTYKTVDKASALQSETLTYTIRVENIGASDATNVLISDTIDSTYLENLTDLSGGGVIVGSTILWTVPNIQSGAFVTYQFSAQVKAGAPDGTMLYNFATIVADNANSYQTNTVNTIINPNNAQPRLDWLGVSGYYGDGVSPDSGDNTTSFSFKVLYTSLSDKSPLTNYPKVHILDNGIPIAGSPFTMSKFDPSDTNYSDGCVYTYDTTLAVSSNHTYYFESYDINSNSAIGAPTVSSNGPVVLTNIKTISYARAVDANGVPTRNGEVVVVQGIVTFVISNKEIYIQDLTGGIDIYQSAGLPIVPAVGDFVEVKGTITYYRGTEELSTIQYINILSSGNPLPSFITGTINQFNSFSSEPIQGSLVKTEGTVISVTPSTQFTIQDSTGSIVVYFKNTANYPAGIAIGNYVIVQGVLGQYDSSSPFTSGYQILPRGTSDYTLLSGPNFGASTKTYSPLTGITSGTQITFTINYVNSGQSTATNVTITDIVNTTYLENITDITAGGVLAANTITWNIGSVPASGSGSVSFKATVKTGTPDGTIITNKADITCSEASTVFSTNTVTVVVLNISTIAQARGTVNASGVPSTLGQTFTVSGIVTAVFGTKEVYIQDLTGGICLYKSSGFSPLPSIGDLLLASGIVYQYNGLTEFSPVNSYSILSSGNSLPPSHYFSSTNAANNEAYEGKFVKVIGKVESKATYSFVLNDGSGPITIYIKTGVGISLASINVGSTYEVQGVLTQYDNSSPYTSGYQILPRNQADILTITQFSNLPYAGIIDTITSPFIYQIQTTGPVSSYVIYKITKDTQTGPLYTPQNTPLITPGGLFSWLPDYKEAGMTICFTVRAYLPIVLSKSYSTRSLRNINDSYPLIPSSYIESTITLTVNNTNILVFNDTASNPTFIVSVPDKLVRFISNGNPGIDTGWLQATIFDYKPGNSLNIGLDSKDYKLIGRIDFKTKKGVITLFVKKTGKTYILNWNGK